MEPLRIFAGYDSREAGGWAAFTHSLLKHSSVPVSVTALTGQQRDGSNAFTYSRFLVPHLCGYSGMAIWLDGSDMLMRADIAELWELRDHHMDCQVVKHEYQTTAARKYIGTAMEADNRDYPRKNWSSVIIFNCASFPNRRLTPESVANLSGEGLHRLKMYSDDRIGALPGEWNHLVREQEPNPDAKIVHYTLGIPAIANYAQDEHSAEWHQAMSDSMRSPISIDSRAAA